MSRWSSSTAGKSPDKLLRRLFRQCGYARVANQTRREEMGQKYKKGYEVRLVLKTWREVMRIRQLLHCVGFKAGRPFKKHSRVVQPIYDKAAVEWFLSTSLEARASKESPASGVRSDSGNR